MSGREVFRRGRGVKRAGTPRITIVLGRSRTHITPGRSLVELEGGAAPGPAGRDEPGHRERAAQSGGGQGDASDKTDTPVEGGED